jgi:hypothetical protein
MTLRINGNQHNTLHISIECRCADCRIFKMLYLLSRYAESRYAECRGAVLVIGLARRLTKPLISPV